MYKVNETTRGLLDGMGEGIRCLNVGLGIGMVTYFFILRTFRTVPDV